MKKQDLKTGMVVEMRNGQKGLVLLDTALLYGDSIVFSANNWTTLEHFADDLLWYEDPDVKTGFMKSMGIMKVYQPRLGTQILQPAFLGKGWAELTLLWERPKDS